MPEEELKITQEVYDKLPFATQAAVTFVSCMKKICESKQSDDIKGDATSLAVRYFEAVVRADFGEKVLRLSADQEVSVETVVRMNALDAIDEVYKKQQQLKNIMELF